MRIATGLAFVAHLTLSATAVAQAGEEQQGMVCMGDAFQLCGDAIPDHEAIKRCLRAKRSQVSPQCGAVLDANQRPGRRKAS